MDTCILAGMDLSRGARILLAALFAFTTAAALLMSVANLVDAGTKAGVQNAWLVPIAIDGFGVTMGIVVYWLRRNGQDETSAHNLLIGVTAVSCVLQMWATPTKGLEMDIWLARLFHGWPAIAVYLGWDKGVLRVLAPKKTASVRKRAVARPAKRVAKVLVDKRDTFAKPQVTAGAARTDTTASTPVDQASTDPSSGTQPEKRRYLKRTDIEAGVEFLRSRGRDINRDTVAEHFGISTKQAERWLARLDDETTVL